MAHRIFDYTPQSDQPVKGLLEKIAKGTDEAAVALAQEEAGKPHKELPAAVKEYVKKEDGRMDALRKQGRTQVAINLLVNGKLAKEDIAKCAGLPLDGVEWLALRFQAEQDA